MGRYLLEIIVRINAKHKNQKFDEEHKSFFGEYRSPENIGSGNLYILASWTIFKKSI